MIAVIGDIMLDEFWFGSVTRFTPESPDTPILKINSKSKRLGGAANVALNLTKLDSSVTLFGVLGIDQASKEINSILKSNSINKKIVYHDTCKAIRKIRVYNDSKYQYRIDLEEKLPDKGCELLDNIKTHNPNIVVISDYNKGTVENPKEIINYCYRNNIEVFVDPKKDLIKYAGATVIKPNLKEFLEWSHLPFEFYIEDFIENNYSELLDCKRRLDVKFLIITVGAEGCVLVSDKVKLYAAPKTEEVDVTGAGDSFLAGLVSQYSNNKDIDKSIVFANVVASKAVSKKGTSYVRRKEL